ncbi:MAG: nickel-type superoxide dismutase maturation protease [Phormidesmis sp.]
MAKLSRDWTEVWQWLLGKRWRVRVEGRSMLPTLQPNDDILVAPVTRMMTLSPGDVVLCVHPFRPGLRMVKRVSETFYDGGCYVLSDNAAEGNDSRSFGVLGREQIVGLVTSRLL